MKKLLFISVLVFMFASLMEAQVPSSIIDVYIVGTSTADTTVNTGLVKRWFSPVEMLYPSSFNSDPVDYRWLKGTQNRPYALWFDYEDRNLTELQKYRPIRPTDALKAIYVSKSFFDSTIYPQAYDLDQIMAIDPTGSNIGSWAMPLRGQYVYFIDRNDMTPTQVKLIPVMVIMVQGVVW